MTCGRTWVEWGLVGVDGLGGGYVDVVLYGDVGMEGQQYMPRL